MGGCIVCTGIRLLVLFVPLFLYFFPPIFKFSSHFSQELCGLEGWNLVHTWTMGGCIVYTGIRMLLLCIPFISTFFFLSNFQTLKCFVTFSQELLGLEDWNLVHMWTVCRCMVYTEVTLLLLLLNRPFISSFSFLSNFQTLKFFVTLVSGTVRPRRLKLGTRVDSGQMYRVYRNKAAATYLSRYSVFFLSNFQTLKIFVTLFSGTVRPRSFRLVHTCTMGGCIV